LFNVSNFLGSATVRKMPRKFKSGTKVAAFFKVKKFRLIKCYIEDWQIAGKNLKWTVRGWSAFTIGKKNLVKINNSPVKRQNWFLLVILTYIDDLHLFTKQYVLFIVFKLKNRLSIFSVHIINSKQADFTGWSSLTINAIFHSSHSRKKLLTGHEAYIFAAWRYVWS